MTTETIWARRVVIATVAAAMLVGAATSGAAAAATGKVVATNGAAAAVVTGTATGSGATTAGMTTADSTTASAATAGATGSSTGAAGTKPSPPPANAGINVWKAAVVARVDLRLATLSALKIAVNGATNLTAADKSTLTTLLADDASGLTALRAKINAETTVAAVKADAKSMIDDYRIYILVTPKVRFTIAADAETALIPQANSAHDKLATVTAQLAAQGKDVSKETAQLATMATRLAAATSALDGQVATLLAIQPGPDGPAIRAKVVTVRAAVRTARDDIAAAVALAKLVRQELKALAG